jgi:hypothetical protein
MIADDLRNVELVDLHAPERATADHVNREAAGGLHPGDTFPIAVDLHNRSVLPTSSTSR